MSLGALVFLVAAGFGPPTWPREPDLSQAFVRERDGERMIEVELGQDGLAARVDVEVRDVDGHVLFHDDLPAQPFSWAKWKGGSVGPWVVFLTLVDREGRRSKTRRLETDVDWVSSNEQQACPRPSPPVHILADTRQSLEDARVRTLDVCAPGAPCLINVNQDPYWVGDALTRNGRGASVLLLMGTVNAEWVAISIESGARPQELLHMVGEEVRAGCVDCRAELNLPADRDVVLKLRLMGRGDAPGRVGAASSETRRIRVHTPPRLYGRNGHPATDCWHPAVELNRPAPPAPNGPTPWLPQFLLFAVLPFAVGYFVQSLRRGIS